MFVIVYGFLFLFLLDEWPHGCLVRSCSFSGCVSFDVRVLIVSVGDSFGFSVVVAVAVSGGASLLVAVSDE